jgi:hypothetical protein
VDYGAVPVAVLSTPEALIDGLRGKIAKGSRMTEDELHYDQGVIDFLSASYGGATDTCSGGPEEVDRLLDGIDPERPCSMSVRARRHHRRSGCVVTGAGRLIGIDVSGSLCGCAPTGRGDRIEDRNSRSRRGLSRGISNASAGYRLQQRLDHPYSDKEWLAVEGIPRPAAGSLSSTG